MARRPWALNLGLLGALLWFGCGEETEPPDGGGGMDASSGTDAGGADASATMDGSSPDASASDASSPTDADVGDGAAGDAASDGGPVSMPCTATGTCDPFDPSACPTGQKCRVTDTGTACEPLTADPPLTEGATCTVDTQCGRGLWCLSFGDGFTCVPMCPGGSIGACGAAAACTGTIGTEPCVRACRPIPARCDIFTQDCASSADACTLATHPETGERYTGCRPAGTRTHGETCGGGAGTCGVGLICVSVSGAATCRYVCGGDDGGAPTCTVTGEACTGLTRSWGVPYCR